MHEIAWPAEYAPGTTDNFISNEVIAGSLTAADIWPFLIDSSKWASYYDNVADFAYADGKGPGLAVGLRFSFVTFGSRLNAEVVELQGPGEGSPGRLAWRGWNDADDANTKISVYHAWLIEDLPGRRVRVLTQESQIGELAAQLATLRPSPMLVRHQDWVDGLVGAAR
ncbi:polyketide cyclase [Mycobacterium sp. SWH-M5]|uniref:polyketide cyclase n=1 Tax=Mycolicibacterium goodii TaxID=134601 RepID=UPI00093F3C64|nr:polyketide cyclase [Mycolicibacterium goodii]OKH74622.1 polyketide cyclase [Mycobacterium sp. SWH-M5]PJK23979.1 polyketide cyclase [Mycolicibacterium goodii]